MDDRELLDKIKKSADREKVPSSLEPENMMKKLDQSQRKTTGTPAWYRWAGWAAAAVLLVTVLGTGVYQQMKPEKEPRGTISEDVKNTQSVAASSGSGTQVEKSEEEQTARDTAEAASEDTDEATVENTNQAASEDTNQAASGNTNQAASGKTDEAVSEDVDEAIGVDMDASPVQVAKSYDEIYEWMKTSDIVYQYDGAQVWPEAEIQEFSAVSDTVVFDTAGTNAAAPISSESTAQADTGAAMGDYSSTNTREENVDEADVVKTDGQYLYLMDRSKGITIVDIRDGHMKVESVLELENLDEQPEEFYVDGDVLQLVVTADESSLEEGEADEEWTGVYYVNNRKVTKVLTYDISDRKNPVKLGSYEQDGSYVSSRKNGDYVYLFTSYRPNIGTITPEAETFVPEAGSQIIECHDIYVPFGWDQPVHGGKNYLVISSISADSPGEAADTKALVSSAELFYVSEEHIYVANSKWEDSQDRTDLASFSYTDGKIRAVAAGNVKGLINDSFSMDEYKGYLRIVTSAWGYESASTDGEAHDGFVSSSRTNGVYVLDEELNLVGSVDGLAKNEEIKSARFMGDTAYFVTYENTDPLFSVDLGDPANPKILGELKITGFSDYLHVYGENLLLGLGWETDPDTGIQKGLKLSMFDTTDKENVKEESRLVLSNITDCPGTWNYKAVMAAPEKNLIGFMITDNQGEQFYAVFSYSKEKGFREELMENLDLSAQGLGDYQDIRGLYVGDNFYTAGSKGVFLYSMTEEFTKKEKLLW